MLCRVDMSHATGSGNPFDQLQPFLHFISEVWDSNMGTKVLCPGLDCSVFSRQLLEYFLHIGYKHILIPYIVFITCSNTVIRTKWP